jgi:hypothetical protein
MENYKNILPDDLFHVITKGVTYELCVAEKNVTNFTKFSDYLTDNISVDVHYCFVIHCELQDGGLFVSTGGFNFCKMDYNDAEILYNTLIDSFHNTYSGNDIVNYVNVSFHPYNTIIKLKEFKSNIGL